MKQLQSTKEMHVVTTKPSIGTVEMATSRGNARVASVFQESELPACIS